MAISTSESGVQSSWPNNATRCYKPNSNWAIPIMCLVTARDRDFSAELQRFGQYESCCPPNANGTNIWLFRRGCGATCYTPETVLAEAFGTCISKVSEGLGISRNDSGIGSCEYINYAKMNSSTSGGVWGRSKMGIWTLVLATTGVSLLGLSGL